MNDQLDEAEFESAAVLYATLLVLGIVGVATTMIVGILGGYFA